MAWRALLPPAERPAFGTMAQLRWFRGIRQCAAAGGRAGRPGGGGAAAARRGVPADLAGATATVDLTLEAVSQLVFTLAGFGLLLASGDRPCLAGITAAGFGIAAGRGRRRW